MKQLLILLFFFLSRDVLASAATPEPDVQTATTSMAIIPYRDLDTEVRTFLGISIPRRLHPWEANKALQKAAQEGNTKLLDRLVDASNPLRLSPVNLQMALCRAVAKNQKAAAEILLTCSALNTLTPAETIGFLEQIPNRDNVRGFKFDKEEKYRLSLFFQTLSIRFPHMVARQGRTSGAFNLPIQAYQEFFLATIAAQEGFSDIIGLVAPDTLRTFDPRMLVDSLYLAVQNEHVEVYNQLKEVLDLNNIQHRQLLFFAAARMGDLHTLDTLPLLPEEIEERSEQALEMAALRLRRPVDASNIPPAGATATAIFNSHPLENLFRLNSKFRITPLMIARFLFDGSIRNDISLEALTILYEQMIPHLSTLLENGEAGGGINPLSFMYTLQQMSHMAWARPLHRRCLEALTDEQLLRGFGRFPLPLALSVIQSRSTISNVDIKATIQAAIETNNAPNLLLVSLPVDFISSSLDTDFIDALFGSNWAYMDNSEHIRHTLRVIRKGKPSPELEAYTLSRALNKALGYGNPQLIAELLPLVNLSSLPTYSIPSIPVATNDLERLRRIQSPLLLTPGHSHVTISTALLCNNLEAVLNIVSPTLDPSPSQARDWAQTSLGHNCLENLRYLAPKLPRAAALEALNNRDRECVATIKSYIAAADGDMNTLRTNLDLIDHMSSITREKLLRVAIQNGRLNAVRLLHPANWHPMVPTLIAEAAAHNDAPILSYLLTHPAITAATPAHIGNATLAAADTNAVESLEMLCSLFEDHPEFSSYARQAYRVAAHQGSADALNLLSSYIPAPMRYKAIPYAVKGGQIQLVRTLLASMSNPVIDLHRAALLTAAHAGQWEVLKDLLVFPNTHYLKRLLTTGPGIP